MLKFRSKSLLAAGLVTVLSMAGTGLSNANAQKIQWRKDWEGAKKAAKSSNKLLMVDMYTDWCGWCKKLDADVFPNAAVVQASRAFIPVKLNAEAEGQSIASRYKVTGFPTILFVDGSGAIVDRIGGYMPAKEYAVTIKGIARSHKEFPGLQARVRANPNDMAASRKLALALMRRERTSEAINLINKLDKPANRASLGSLYNAVASHYTSTDDSAALAWYGKTLSNSKKSDELLEARLGTYTIHAMRGDKPKMRSELQNIIKMPGAPQEVKTRARAILNQLNSDSTG